METLDYSDLFGFVEDDDKNKKENIDTQDNSDKEQLEENTMLKKKKNNKKNNNNIHNNSRNKQFNYQDCPLFDLFISSNENDVVVLSKEDNCSLTTKFLVCKLKIIRLKTNENLFVKGKREENTDTNIPSSYWKQRYYLFSKYDEGIKLDHESKSVIYITLI